MIVSILRELLNNIVRTAEELGTHHILVPFHYIRESTSLHSVHFVHTAACIFSSLALKIYLGRCDNMISLFSLYEPSERLSDLQ